MGEYVQFQWNLLIWHPEKLVQSWSSLCHWARTSASGPGSIISRVSHVTSIASRISSWLLRPRVTPGPHHPHLLSRWLAQFSTHLTMRISIILLSSSLFGIPNSGFKAPIIKASESNSSSITMHARRPLMLGSPSFLDTTVLGHE